MKRLVAVGMMAVLVVVFVGGCFPMPKRKEAQPEQTQQEAGQISDSQGTQSENGYVQGSEGMVTPETGFEEDYYEDVQDNGGLWPWTNYQKVSKQDLGGLSDWDLDLMRNEIYARHGYIFNRQDLRSYFESQSWYFPAGLYENREQVNKSVEQQLNSIEKYNAEKILQYQKGQW